MILSLCSTFIGSYLIETRDLRGRHLIEHGEPDKKTLEKRLRFEEMVADLSARFMAAPYDQVDSEIHHALRRIQAFFQIDRCALLDVQVEKAVCRITHATYGKGIEQVPGEINLAELYPWSYEKLLRGEIVNISRLEDYPEEALKDRQTHVATGNKSLLDIPLLASEQISKIIVINSTRRHQAWPKEYIPRLRLLGEIFVNALGHRENRLKLEEQLRFKMLLAEISGRFVNLPTNRIDSHIEEAQRRICELFDLDRATLWQAHDDDPEKLLLTHYHQPPGSPPVPEGQINAMDIAPWATRKALRGEIVAIAKLSDLPPEADRDRESLRAFGTRSTILVPLSVGEGPVFGMVAFAVMREERSWTETVVSGCKLIAQVFANALLRKQAEAALCESEARLSLTTDAVEAGLWIMNADSKKVWVSQKCRELFHFAPDEEIHYESFFRVIHPEDRDRINQAVQQALRSGEKLRCDYRIVTPDGTIRWITARGQCSLKSTAEPYRMTGLSLDITERKQLEAQLRANIHEIEKLKQRFESENIYLREEVRLLVEHTEIVGQSKGIRKILAQAEQVAQTDSTVLLLGETGTGKELLARAIHSMSHRKDKPLVTVNCASLPPTLIESELFGRERGAYTGALTKMAGRFEVANGATLFLDEIGELSLDLQSKLLRVIEEGKFERLGSTKTLHVDVRLIAATNRDLAQEVKEGRFRKDLYYRLNVFPIAIPPLRERSEDIPLLVWAFVSEFQKRMGKEIESIPRKSIEALQAYSWPGNVRELRNVIERAMIVSNGKTLVIQVPKPASLAGEDSSNLEEMERRHILSVLEKTGWRVAGKAGAAEILGLNRSTLLSKMKKLSICRPTFPCP